MHDSIHDAMPERSFDPRFDSRFDPRFNHWFDPRHEPRRESRYDPMLELPMHRSGMMQRIDRTNAFVSRGDFMNDRDFVLRGGRGVVGGR
jgi:hypothetical protein